MLAPRTHRLARLLVSLALCMATCVWPTSGWTFWFICEFFDTLSYVDDAAAMRNFVVTSANPESARVKIEEMFKELSDCGITEAVDIAKQRVSACCRRASY